jgi:hypothetical protein
VIVCRQIAIAYSAIKDRQMASLFSNKIAQNSHRLFSNRGLPNGVAYSAIKDCQIAIALISNKRAPNRHRLFSDKNSAKLPAIT